MSNPHSGASSALDVSRTQTMRLPKRYAPALFAFIMSSTLSCVLSFAITAINRGFGDALVAHWLSSYALSFSLAFPSVTVIAPVVRRLVDRITA